MFHSRKKSGLFREYPLDHYLRQASSSMEAEIKNMPLEKINEEGEAKIIDSLFDKYNVIPPVLLEDKKEINANEKDITIRGDSRFDIDDGPITVRGLSIDVTIPFEGNGELFRCTPSRRNMSGTPSADIENGQLVMNYETREQDPEKIKGTWQKDINDIKQNLEWIQGDIDRYSATLKNNIQAALAHRKKEAEENASLISKLKE